MFTGKQNTGSELSVFNEFIFNMKNLLDQGRSIQCLAEYVCGSFYRYEGRKFTYYQMRDFFNASLLLLLKAEKISSKDFADFVYEFIEINKREKPQENNQLEIFYDAAIIFLFQRGVSAQFLAYFVRSFINIIELNARDQISRNIKPVQAAFKQNAHQDNKNQRSNNQDNEVNKSSIAKFNFLNQGMNNSPRVSNKYKHSQYVWVPKNR